jgi:drug/metabolite transporter (DMT)-like permease
MRAPSNTGFTLLIVLAMTAWGASWTSAKLITHMAAPEVLIFWRFLFTFLSFIPVMFVFRKSIRISRASILKIILGSLFIVAYNKFFFTGLRHGFAGAGGVLVTTMNPILTFLFTLVIFRQAITKRAIIGLILGFLGGFILLEVRTIDLQKLVMTGNAYFLLAAASWALLTLTSEKSRQSMSPLVFSFYVYGLSAFIDLWLALPHGVFDFSGKNILYWSNILYLSVFATTFATTIYFTASSRLGSQKASSFIFLVPTSAVFISWLVLGEVIRLNTIVGGIIAVAAVYLINTKPREKSASGMPLPMANSS